MAQNFYTLLEIYTPSIVRCLHRGILVRVAVEPSLK